MGRRMTNEDVHTFIESVNRANELGSGGTIVMSSERLTMLAMEISAARASEVGKDGVIKTLADALESVFQRGTQRDDVYEQVKAALRLVGRES